MDNLKMDKWNYMGTYQKVAFVGVFVVAACLLISAIMMNRKRVNRKHSLFMAFMAIILIGLNFAWVEDDL